MNKMLASIVALVPALVLASSAHAGPRDQFPQVRRLAEGRYLQRLVDRGFATQADVDGLKALVAQGRACRLAVVQKQQPRGSCLGKFIEIAKARRSLLEKALPKVQKPRMQRRMERQLKRLNRRITKMERRFAKTGGVVAPVAPPAVP